MLRILPQSLADWAKLVGATMCVLLIIAGNCITIISINYWLLTFPSENSSAQFAIQLISGSIYVVVFGLLFFGCAIRNGFRSVLTAVLGASRKQCLARLGLLILVGLTDVGNALLNLYATPHTPEILQAVLQTTIPFFTLMLTYWLVNNERRKNYKSKLLVTSFVVMMVGLGISSLSVFLNSTQFTMSSSVVAWMVFYLASCAVYGLWCVAQRLYLDTVGENSGSDEKQDQIVGALSEEEGEENEANLAVNVTYEETSCLSSSQESTASARDRRRLIGTGTVQKMGLLFGDSLFQLLFTLILLPIDAIPWFGNSPNVGQTWTNFTSGIHCIFHCEDSLRYGLWYSAGYAITYIGCAYLNHYSPTLSSMMLQLSSPLTAVLLLLVPRWNVAAGGSATIWYQQLVGIVLLLVASVLYNMWERDNCLPDTDKEQALIAHRKQISAHNKVREQEA